MLYSEYISRCVWFSTRSFLPSSFFVPNNNNNNAVVVKGGGRERETSVVRARVACVYLSLSKVQYNRIGGEKYIETLNISVV